jgi:transposase-like protein
MGQILHGSATATEAIRRAIQNSQASPRELAARYGINPKTVAKWRDAVQSAMSYRTKGASVDGTCQTGRGR